MRRRPAAHRHANQRADGHTDCHANARAHCHLGAGADGHRTAGARGRAGTPTDGDPMPISPEVAEAITNVGASMVLIETNARAGSGILIEGGYILTSAQSFGRLTPRAYYLPTVRCLRRFR